jgi:hypothetical protein
MDLTEKRLMLLEQRCKRLEEIVEKLVNKPFRIGYGADTYDEDTRDLWRSSQQLFFDNGPNEQHGIGQD